MKSFFSKRRLPFPLVACCLLILAGAGCTAGGPPTAPAEGVDPASLAGAEFGVAVFDSGESLTLMGRILFTDVSGESAVGKWRLEAWGDQTAFPTLPVNRGEGFPGGAHLGNFTGMVFGDTVILRIPLLDSPDTLGLVFERRVGEMLSGTASLIPGLAFDGTFEALPYPGTGASPEGAE